MRSNSLKIYSSSLKVFINSLKVYLGSLKRFVNSLDAFCWILGVARTDVRISLKIPFVS
jgi:hypothetical protein